MAEDGAQGPEGRGLSEAELGEMLLRRSAEEGQSGRRIHVIVNPASGQDRPILSILNTAFSGSDVEWNVSITKGAGDARRQAAEQVESGVDVIAVYGGDGTIAEVASSLIGTDVALAILPGGTANVIAQALGIPSDLAEACTLAGGQPAAIRSLDMGQVGFQYFMIGVGIGIPGAVADKADRQAKDRLGTLAYAAAALQSLREAQPSRYHMTIDGEQVEREGVACVILNSGQFGVPGLVLSSQIDDSDGLLDIFVVERASIDRLLAVAASVVTQNEVLASYERWQAREVMVVSDPPQPVQADGESLGAVPVRVQVLPRAVRVIVPASAG
jgi:diacylglycerol kinase (ATP)